MGCPLPPRGASARPRGNALSPEPGSGARRRRLFALLRVVLALVVLALVARSLSWRDELVFVDAGAIAHVVSGEIEGDWKASAIEFRALEASTIPVALPADVRAALETGASARIERSPGPQGLSWRPSMQRVFRGLDPAGFAGALAALVLGHLIAVTRWWRLLRVAGCAVQWFDALRLAFIGLFFNLVVPGLTGGDVVKAVLAAKENPSKRTDAVVTVVLDRVIGLVALAGLAVVVALAPLSANRGEFRPVVLPLAAGLLAALAGAFVYGHQGLRRRLGIERLLARLPLGTKLAVLDRAALVHLARPGELAIALCLSLANHVAVVLGTLALARAFGVEESAAGLAEHFVIVPLANIASALPVAPGGWGIGEAAFGALYAMAGAEAALGVAVSVTFRLCQLVLGVVGGLFLLVPGARAEVRGASAGE